MKYIFNFENRDRPIRFNREKLILAALQDPEQLYYMMDTQYEGIYQAEAAVRRRQYGTNSYRKIIEHSKCRFMPLNKLQMKDTIEQLERQKISVFRRGMHFYAETEHEDLVPGDVIFISTGDVIPADIRIVFSKDVEVDQRMYTGKEIPVKKSTVYREKNICCTRLTDLPNICLVGERVTSGMARGVVINTGNATYLSYMLQM